MLRHGGTETIAGQLLDRAIEKAKVEVGISGDLLTASFDDYGHLLTKCWIKDVWYELHTQQIKMMEKTASLTLKRDNDIFLNEQFLTKGYPKSQLVLINRCRLYLQVTTQSDITSGDGCYLLRHITQRHNPLQHYSSLQWPRQEYPSQKAWLLWRKAIRQCFPTDAQARLREPLGKWRDYDIKWGSFFDSSTTSLFVRGQRWMQFQTNTQTFTGNNE